MAKAKKAALAQAKESLAKAKEALAVAARKGRRLEKANLAKAKKAGFGGFLMRSFDPLEWQSQSQLWSFAALELSVCVLKKMVHTPNCIF